MASAAASRPPAPPPPPPPPPPSAAMQWLSPRVSFSLDDAGGRDASMAAGGGAGKASADFEFFLAGCSAVSTMLPADELFSGGKLVPLRIPTTAPTSSTADGVATRPPLAPAPTQEQQPETPRAEEEVEATKDAVDTAEPKAVPARRWRDLLRMRKQQASSSSSSSTDTKPLRRLLRRGPKAPEQEPSLNHPLLRDPDEPEKPEKAPAAAPTPTPTPPPPSQQHHQQLPPKIRLTAAQATAPPPPPPPPPPAVAADSPRLNAAGKVVFNGLGRSSSSPSSLAGGRRHRAGSGSGGMERSYSAHVRVTPVLNVPVCRKSVSVFGIDRLFSPSSAAAAHAAAKKGKVAKKEAVTAAPPPSSQ
ncbi:hypothetical protein ACQ4PT_070659 [Festuca glaucescens]